MPVIQFTCRERKRRKRNVHVSVGKQHKVTLRPGKSAKVEVSPGTHKFKFQVENKDKKCCEKTKHTVTLDDNNQELHWYIDLAPMKRGDVYTWVHARDDCGTSDFAILVTTDAYYDQGGERIGFHNEANYQRLAKRATCTIM